MSTARKSLPMFPDEPGSGVRLIPAVYPDGFTRPETRGDCESRPDPCPHCYRWVYHYRALPSDAGPVVTCPHCSGRVMWGVAEHGAGHEEWIAYDANTEPHENENRELNRCRPCVLESCAYHANRMRKRRAEPITMGDTCVLDIADDAGSLERVGGAAGVTRERIRQIEFAAMGKLRGHRARTGSPVTGLRRIVMLCVEAEPGVAIDRLLEAVAGPFRRKRESYERAVRELVAAGYLREESGCVWCT